MSTAVLTRVERLDSIRLDSTYFTEEGYLIDHPVISRLGIFDYQNPDGSIRRELRLPEHVFDPKSLATYLGKPVIISHDAGRVDKGNVGYEAVGTILTEGYQDGQDVRCKIVIHEIDEVKRSGLRELSLGYDLVLDETPGEWEGQPYDAVQTEIRINHLALVSEARAGDQARLNIDGKTNKSKGVKKMAKKTNPKALSVDELQQRLDARRQSRADNGNPERDPLDPRGEGEGRADLFTPADSGTPADTATLTPENRVQMIKDRRARRDEVGAPETHEAALDCLLQQDEDIDALLGLCDELMAQRDFAAPAEPENEDEGIEPEGEGAKLVIKMDGKDQKAISEAIAHEVAMRTKLLRMGDRLNLDGLEDMTPMQMKAAIVKAVNPNMRLDGKGTSYINAAYDLAVDTIMSEKSTDRQRRQMSYRKDDNGKSQPTGKSMAESARDAMNNRLMNGGNE